MKYMKTSKLKSKYPIGKPTLLEDFEIVPVICCDNFKDVHGEACDNLTCECECHD